MRGGIVGAGVVLLVLGIIFVLFFWPFVAVPAFGYYTGPNETPREVNKGEVYKCTGTLYGAESKGGYTAMVIDFDNGESLAWVEKGGFNKGERIIFEFKVNEDINESDMEEREKLEMSKSAKDDFMEGAKEAPEDEYKIYYDQFKDNYDEFGVSVEAKKTPDLIGLIGLIILILGIILMIVGGVLKSKKQRPARQPPRDHYDDRRPREYENQRGHDYDYDRESGSRPPPRGRRPPPRDYDYDYDHNGRYYDDEPPRPPRDHREPPPPQAPRGRTRVDEPVRDEDDWREEKAQRPKIPKFCPECGEETGGKKFCMECGEKLI